MRRLLFVDDDSAILRALERMLRAQRREWECVFSDQPEGALDLVESFAPDAVISDMLMPGMDGAAFLAAATTRRRVMARFILSGEVGAGSLTRMAMVAHQCLAKPCRGDVLTRVLKDALIDPETVTAPEVREGLYAIGRLPVAPGPHAALRRCLNDAPGDRRDDAAIRIIESSPGIATKLLQVAIWTRLGYGEAPTTVREAYYQLGPAAVASLLDSDLLRPPLQATVGAFQAGLWARCERVGPVASALAAAEGMSGSERSRVALVALWHAAAPLLLDSMCPEDHRAVREAATHAGRSLAAAERERFGLSSSQMLGQLLRLWGLSPHLADAVASTDAPLAESGHALSASGLAHIAVAIVGQGGGMTLADDTLEYVDRLGLRGRLDTWIQLAHAADKAA